MFELIVKYSDISKIERVVSPKFGRVLTIS